MRVSVLQENLAKGLGIVGRAVPTRAPERPSLQNILLKTEDGRLKLSGTNQELGITMRIGAKVDADGGVGIPARTLVDWVNTLPPERVDLELDNETQTLTIRCGASVAKIQGVAEEEMMEVPEAEAEGTELPAATFQTMIDQVVFAASRDDSARPVLTGILTRVDSDRVRLAASDGFRMAMRTATLENIVDNALNLVIPARAMSEVGRIIGADSDSTMISISVPSARNQVMFHMNDVDVVSSLIDGKFPDVDSLVPKASNTTVTMLTGDLLQACKRTEIFARESNMSMRMRIQPGEGASNVGQVTIGATAKERGENEGTLDAIVNGPSLEISFNVRFFIDMLNVLDTEQVVLELNDATKSGVVKAAGRQDFVYIVSPMSPRAT
jgi:DNA polymerase-3 subunit beta